MRRHLLLLSGLLALAACGGGGTVAPPPPPPNPPPPPPPPPPAPVATVTVAPSAPVLVPNQTVLLTATAKDAAGNTLTGRTITWSSSAEATATVSNGLVTAAAATGNATVTASSEGKNGSTVVTVNPGGFVGPQGGVVQGFGGTLRITVPAAALAAATALTVSQNANPPAHPKLIAGTAFDLGPNGTAFAQPVTLDITYAAGSLPAGAQAAQLRLHRFTAGAWAPVAGSTVNPATRVVTGQTSSFSTYGVIEIPAPVYSVTVGPAGPLTVGAERQMLATLRDALGNELTNRVVTWLSTTPATASVGPSTGLVTANAVGNTTIRATSENVIGELALTVNPAVEFPLQTLASSVHVCGVAPSGIGWCWGANTGGQLGDGTQADRSRPVRVTGANTWSVIRPGLDDDSDFTCALATNGTAWCWGLGPEGELGNGGTGNSLVPVAVSGGRNYSRIASGDGAVCAITTAGAAWCWGDNGEGRLGDGSAVAFSAVPVAVAGGHLFEDIAAAEEAACARKANGEVWCWGHNSSGQLGDGTTTDRSTPVKVQTAQPFVEIVSGGRGHFCARTEQGAAQCWGGNNSGQLGNGTLTDSSVPVPVSGGHVFAQLAGDQFHSCGRKANGQAWCWGEGGGGRLGDGAQIDRTTPVQVQGGLVFGHLTATCGLTTAGEAWCWGPNFAGQLGDGTNTQSSVPVKVLPPLP